jgi:hypothetical protein
MKLRGLLSVVLEQWRVVDPPSKKLKIGIIIKKNNLYYLI